VVGSRGVAIAAAGAGVDVRVVDTGLDAETGAPDSEVRMIDAARARRRDVAGGVGMSLVNSEALEDGVDITDSPTEAFATEGVLAAFSAAIGNLPARNALTNGLAIGTPSRGWVLAEFVIRGRAVLTSGPRGFTPASGNNPAGDSCNRLGSIWSSLIVAESGGVGRGGELFSSPNDPEGELRGSTSEELPNPWR